MAGIINNLLIWMKHFHMWFIVNWLTIVSIVLSGLISLIVSAIYYNKGNRNNLQMTMIFPISELLKERYSRKNYGAICNLSENYCARYLKKNEKRLLIQLVTSYKEISNYNIVGMNADILSSYFEYILRKNGIEVKPVPFEHEGEIVFYDYPPDLQYLNYDLQKIFKEYDPDFQPKECESSIVSMFSHYCHECYTDANLPYFNDYSLDEVLKQSKIKKNWDDRFDAMEKAKTQFLELKIVKELSIGL